MNKTIHELNALISLANDDELIVYDVATGTSKKIKKSDLKNQLAGDLIVDTVQDGNLKAVTSNAVFDYVNTVNKVKSIFTVADSVTVPANNYAYKDVDISAFGFSIAPITIIVPLGLSSYGAYQIDQITKDNVRVLFYNHHADAEITPTFLLVLIQV